MRNTHTGHAYSCKVHYHGYRYQKPHEFPGHLRKLIKSNTPIHTLELVPMHSIVDADLKSSVYIRYVIPASGKASVLSSTLLPDEFVRFYDGDEDTDPPLSETEEKPTKPVPKQRVVFKLLKYYPSPTNDEDIVAIEKYIDAKLTEGYEVKSFTTNYNERTQYYQAAVLLTLSDDDGERHVTSDDFM